MSDPITLAALIGATLGNVALNVAGARADALLAAFGVAAKAKITGQDGSLPTNHDVQKAVRLAHVEALRATLADFVKSAPDDKSRREYARRVRDWLEPQVKLLNGADPNWPSTPDLVNAIDHALAGHAGHEGYMKASAEEAVWAELEHATRPVHDSFKAHFLGQSGARSWFVAFGAFIGDGIKTNANFRSIFAAAKQAEVSQKLDAYAEGQAREAVQMREQIASMLDTLGRIEDRIEENQALLIQLAVAGATQTLIKYGTPRDAETPRIQFHARSGLLEAQGGNVRVSIERLPESHVSNLVGREAELNALAAAWAEKRVHVACLVGFGGVGKSALVQHWLARLAARNYSGARAIFAWSFEGQNTDGQEASADAFIAEALTFFGGQGAPLNARERGLYLAQLVQATPSILILDGLEVIQSGDEGHLRDPAVSALLKVLAAKNPDGLCVVTTRSEVDELKPYVGQTVQVVALGGLSAAAGTNLLRDLGVKGTDLDLADAVEEYRGHALFLTLLGGWLRSWKEGDIRKRSELDDSAEPDSLRRMMSSYEQLLGPGAELEMLHVIGLFSRPAPLGAIDAIRAEPPIPHLTDNLVGLKRAEWNHVIQRLRDLKLILDPPPEAEEAEPHFDAHAMVSKYFAQKLRDEHPQSWVEANRRLSEFYRSRPEKHLPDTLEEMADLFQAVVHGCRARAHEDAWNSVYWPRIRREEDGYSATVLGACGADLVALSGFFVDGDWETPVQRITPEIAAHACTEAGFDLRGLGRLEEAIQAQEAGLARHRVLTSWGASNCAGNLSETLTLHGQFARAQKAAEESISFARQALSQAATQEKRLEAQRTLYINFATLADVQHQRGQFPESERNFIEAERILRESAPTDSDAQHLIALRGFHYCDLLLTLGRSDDAMRRAEYAERIARANERRYPLGLAQLTMARISALRGERSKARTLLEQASEALRQSGFQEMILRALLCSAEIHTLSREFPAARAELEEALEVAASASMRLLEMDAHVQLAELDAALGDAQALRAQTEVARRKTRGFGYKRKEARLEELASAIGPMSVEVSDQDGGAVRYAAAESAFLEAYLALDPVAGTTLAIPGDHDARLPPTNKRERDLWLSELETRGRELAGAATGRLDDSIDADLAQAGVRGMRIAEAALDPTARNPGFYVEAVSRSLYALLARTDLEFEEKIDPLLHRLRAVPRFLGEGKQTIKHAARVLLDNAIADAEGTAVFLKSDCRAFLAGAPKGVPTGDAQTALGQAETALSNFVSFLKGLRGKAEETFALGVGPFDELLHEVHLLRQDARTLQAQGDDLVNSLIADLKVASRATLRHERWWEAISLLEKNPPTKAGLLADYRTVLGEAREHVRQGDVVGLGKVGSLVVLPTPPFARANLPFAAYIASPPFARTGRAEFWVSPPSEGLAGRNAQLALSRHHRGRMAVACVHEGYPGHHVQFAHAAHVKRPIRHLFASNVFSEGWGLYCENLMRKEGFLRESSDGGAIEISMLRDQLWRAARIVVDVGLHCFGMTRKGAEDLLVQMHVLDRPNAEAEVMYYCSAPTQPMSYMIGRLLMEDTIRRCHKARGGTVPIGRVRDEVLSHGSLPFPLLERALGMSAS